MRLHPSRLPWIDHLRTLVIVLVVNMHACVTYSHVGDWYAMSDNEPTLAAKVPFILWQASLQSFFMGLLFFVSAYFAFASLQRRGTASFLRERLFRLGLPTLFYMLVIHPFIVLGLNPWNASFPPSLTFYTNYLFSGDFIGESGPLWFAFALLIFCLGLVLLRALRPFPTASITATTSPSSAPRASAILLFIALISLSSFLVRLVQPIGTNVINFQLCFFPQYLAFFAAGLHAARHGWLLPLARSSLARRAGWLALFAGPCSLLALLLLGADAGLASFFGGWHWQAAALALWEQLAGVGFSLGLVALFSTSLNRETPLLRWLSDRSFAVYVLHAPVLVALMILFRSLPENLYFLAALLTVTGLLASYALADLTRRIPGLRAIL